MEIPLSIPGLKKDTGIFSATHLSISFSLPWLPSQINWNMTHCACGVHCTLSPVINKACIVQGTTPSPQTHRPHIYYLPSSKKSTLCSALALHIGFVWILHVTEPFNIHNFSGYCAASSFLYRKASRGLNEHHEGLHI